MKFDRRPKEDPEINLIPMIDVLLVIIIFLMLTTTYSKFAELQINLPSASAEKLERANEISVVISAGGQFLLQRRPIEFTDVPSFAEALRRAGSGLKDPIVVINADNNATHRSVIRVMDAARQAGYGQVAFAVEQSNK